MNTCQHMRSAELGCSLALSQGNMDVWNCHNASYQAWAATHNRHSLAESCHKAATRLYNMLFQATGNALYLKLAGQHESHIAPLHAKPQPIVPRIPNAGWYRRNRDYSHRNGSSD